jgi:hypothetical protein
MMPLLILGGVFVLYELVTNSQLLHALLPPAGSTIAVPESAAQAEQAASATPPATNIPTETVNTTAAQTVQQSMQKQQTIVGAGAAVVGTAVTVGLGLAASAGLLAASTAALAIPIAGVVIAAVMAIYSILMSASAARAKAAENENQAVANFVAAFDTHLSQVVTAFNNGSLGDTWENAATNGVTLLEVLWKNFWSEVTPQIQSGRNGCNSGAAINPSGSNFQCTGSWGASCCVGGGVIRPTIYHVENAMTIYAKSCGPGKIGQATVGTPVKAYAQPVYPSKYGGASRQGYYIMIGQGQGFTPQNCGGGTVPPCEAINAAQQAAEHLPAGTAIPTV